MKKILVILFITNAFFQSSSCQTKDSGFKENDAVVDNDILTLKLDLTRGGAISWLSLSGSERSLVNIADEGRYIQQSYYAGKSIDRKAAGQAPNWSPWSWNPIQVGDAFRNRAEILDFRKNGNEMYVKCIPMQWDMNNKPAEAEMEQWTTLQGSVLKVRNRLTPDKEAADASTSYIAPVKKEILYKNSVYEYEYYIIIGNLKEIRSKVYELNSELK